MSDPGPDLVDHVRAALAPEPQWCHESPRGFAWWPLAAPQHIRAEEPRRHGGAWVVRAHADLALALRVAGTGAMFGALSRWNAARHGLSAVRWDAESGLVSLHASVTTDAAGAALAAQRLAHAAVLQIGEAHAADALRASLAGEPPAAGPPGGAARESASALAHAWQSYTAAPDEVALDAARARLAELVAATPAPWTRVQAQAGGLVAELPAAGAGDPAAPATPGASTALLRVHTTQPHPRLGPGMLMLLSAPAAAEPVRERADATAALLDEAEAREWTGLDQLGGWCVHPDAGLVHATFVTALALQPGLVERLVWQSAARARWMRGFLARVRDLRRA